MSGKPTVSRWAARPVQAVLVRAFALVAPFAGSIAFVHFASTWVEQPTSSLWLFLAWWFAVSLSATAVLFVIDRLTRRLLPLAALLKLSLIFPDETPSRLKTGLRSGSVASLEKRLALLARVKRARTPRESAQRLLELVAALNAHDRLTRGHSERVRAYSVMIGKELRLSTAELDLLNWAALLHDIGKLEVPQRILTKPGRPSDEEWQVLREHPRLGEQLALPLRSWLGSWASAVGDHHERWDGRGYPRGLASEEISLGGRIVAVADVFDVITSARSYKEPANTAEARKEIARCAGSQFDPSVVRAFLNVSLGRMRPILGPLSWLSHAPLLARIPLTPSVGTLGGAFGVVATSAATGLVPHPVAPALAAPTKPKPVATARTAAAAPAPSSRVAAPVNPARVTFDRPSRIPHLDLVSGVGLVASLPLPSSDPPRITLTQKAHEPGRALPLALPVSQTASGAAQVQAPIAGRESTSSNAAVEEAPPSQEPAHAPPVTTVPAPSPKPVDVPTPRIVPTLPPKAVATATEREVVVSTKPASQPASFKAGPDQAVLEDQGRQSISGWASIDPGSADKAGRKITFAVSTSRPALFSAEPAVAPNGTLTFQSAPNANGTATVTVKAVDEAGPAGGGDSSAPQTFTITVVSVNDAPSFAAGADQTVLEDSSPKPVAGWVTGVNPGPSDESSQVVSFSVTSDNPSLFAVQPRISADGSLTYEPAPDANGSATLEVTAVDDGGTANGGTSTGASRTFTITVVPVNDAPSFNAGPDQTATKNAGVVTVSGWATAISAGPKNESAQSVTFSVGNDNEALFAVQPAIAADGTLTYTLKDGKPGTATVTVQAQDGGGTTNGGSDTSTPKTFSITVLPRNEAPVFDAGPNQSALSLLGKRTVPDWATDISPGGADESGQSVTFTVTSDNPGLFTAQPTVAPNGTLTYTPGLLALGSATVTVQAHDNGGTTNGGVDTSAPQTFTITIL